MISKGSCPHAIDVLFCRNRDGPGDAVRTSDDAPREHAEGAQVVRRCLSSTKPKKHERTKTANLGLRNLKIRVARRSARVAALKFKMPATKPAKLNRRQMEPVESSTERFQPRSSARLALLFVFLPSRRHSQRRDARSIVLSLPRQRWDEGQGLREERHPRARASGNMTIKR